jgi:transposase-like protein
MMRNNSEIKAAIRYSEAFKMQVVRELEAGGINVDQMRRKYGVGGCGTIPKWISQYGNGSIAKVIRVEKPEERNETEQLKRRVRALERALADTNIDLALERQYTRLACERAGIKDLAEFKKKAAGQLPTGP